tara:strand:+ start:173 stop:1141 length:969 start_codon:yes stop_codon:yes gene_type:complete
MTYGLRIFNDEGRTLVDSTESFANMVLTPSVHISLAYLKNAAGLYPVLQNAYGTLQAAQTSGIFLARPRYTSNPTKSALTNNQGRSYVSGYVLSRGYHIHNTATDPVNGGDGFPGYMYGGSNYNFSHFTTQNNTNDDAMGVDLGSGIVMCQLVSTYTSSNNNITAASSGEHGLDVYLSIDTNQTKFQYSATRGRTPDILAAGTLERGERFVYEVPDYINAKQIFALIGPTQNYALETNSTGLSTYGGHFKTIRQARYIFDVDSSSNFPIRSTIYVENEHYTLKSPYPASGVNDGGRIEEGFIASKPLPFALFLNPWDSITGG